MIPLFIVCFLLKILHPHSLKAYKSRSRNHLLWQWFIFDISPKTFAALQVKHILANDRGRAKPNGLIN